MHRTKIHLKHFSISNQLAFVFTMGIALAAMPVCAATESWKPASAPLMTRWAKDVNPQNPLPEYPRPQLTRKDWLSLNGLWETALTATDAAQPSAYDGRILVPYPYESALSGVGEKSIPDKRLWYRRTFTIPRGWKGQNVLLHLGAVNYDSAVFVNGQKVGDHRGGYDAFTFDITSQLKSGDNELVVSAWNPVRSDVEDAQVLGKQRMRPSGIFYTAATGIWQPVWLEPVPASHIESLKFVPDIDAGVLRLSTQVQGETGLAISVTAKDGSKTIDTVTGFAGQEISIPVKNAHLWSPDDPHLYTLQVKLMRAGKMVDSVNSYFAMRKVALGKDDKGRLQIMLNNKFLLEVGALDQGYWPDGIYTAPTDDALRYDIQVAKDIGWNLLRKHAKVEPARWYYWTDKLGILVWQDMPQMFGPRNGSISDGAKQQFETEWRRIIAEFYNVPSIIVWTTFNEGWGQHDTASVVALTKQLDPSRLVNNASGWTDMKVGDLHDTHAYPGPGAQNPEATRAAVNGEFGGVTMNIPDHRWRADQVMGYGAVLKDEWLATKRYQGLLKAAYQLADERATSAFVYTQITDVEQEINGIMTYDRALIKLDKKIITAANKGEFLPLPPNPNPEFVPTAQDAPVSWHYTVTQPAAGWEATGFDDMNWKTGNAVFGHNVANVRTDWQSDDIWIRRIITLPSTIPAKLTLLVQHDEDAEIYLNGVLAGKVSGFAGEYVSIPVSAEARAALKSGKNIIAAHCHNTTGGQGIDVGIVEATK